METLHLCFYELSDKTQKELKEHIINYWASVRKNNTNTPINKHSKQLGIDKLFNLNNAGIDIDIFPYMTY